MNPERPILITGVGKRIGLALAEHLLANGQRVLGTYRRHYPSLDRLTAQGAILYPCDFYQQAQLDQLIQQLQAKHPQLRAIIHNASDWLAEGGEHPPQQVLEKMLQVHVHAPYQLNLALADALQPPPGQLSDIIHLTDYVAATGSAKHIAYAASKAALANLTHSFAARLAPTVKVNAIAPAMILFNPTDDAAYRAKTLQKSLLGIEPGSGEVIASVEYLLNSRYVTGRTLHVDGGRHLR